MSEETQLFDHEITQPVLLRNGFLTAIQSQTDCGRETVQIRLEHIQIDGGNSKSCITRQPLEGRLTDRHDPAVSRRAERDPSTDTFCLWCFLRHTFFLLLRVRDTS